MKANFDIKINRNYKDRIFRLLFSEANPQNLLDLYNAVNGSEHTDISELEITTLEDVVYMKFKNDASFIIDCSLNVYEHQSTYNPNMPIRGFLYFADVYRNILTSREYNLYGTKHIKLPIPKYVIFYNGLKDISPIVKLQLADSFDFENSSLTSEEILQCKQEYNWTATIYNILNNNNSNLMEKCRILWEYSSFVFTVRSYMNEIPAKSKEEDIGFINAVNRAVDECIKKNILKDFLTKHKSEVVDILLTEYDEEKVMEMFKRDFLEEGREEGAAKERRKNFIGVINMLLGMGISKEDAVKKACDITGISFEEALLIYENN